MAQNFDDRSPDIIAACSRDFKGPWNRVQHTLDRITSAYLCCGETDHYYAEVLEAVAYCSMVEKLLKSLRPAEHRKRCHSKNYAAKCSLVAERAARYSF